ncbi:MAG: hypothetical protein ACI89T_001147 [Cognaticolwellia sp.]|jgi:hypothetical protein
MLIIKCNKNLSVEKLYILNIIFSEWYSTAYRVDFVDDHSVFTITLPNSSVLTLSSVFWDLNIVDYLTKDVLPESTLLANNNFICEPDIPILYGDAQMSISERKISCGIDVFATCFFMLSRIEEAITKVRDNHDRFPATASVAYQNGFLERPIVDEYVEMLWNMLIYLDSSLVRKSHQTKTFVTCDVDWPFDPIRYSFKRTFISSAADLIKRRSPKLMLATCKRYMYRLLSIKQVDNYRDSLDWMMDVNEDAGNKVAFYFIPLNTSTLDSEFSFDSKKMRVLFRQIAERGHEIGIHPGYECFNNPELFKQSADVLKRVLREENICQPNIGGRMHYLRWDVLTTPHLWESNGFDYDSTLSFADKSGFRCGTSREFTMFDLVNRKPLKLKQRPLINMECTILDDRYEALGYSDVALSRFRCFKDYSKKYNGIYTLLWHNSYINNADDRKFYRELII